MRKGIIVNVILGFLLFSLTGSVWASDTGTKISLDEGNLFRHRFQIVPNHGMRCLMSELIYGM